VIELVRSFFLCVPYIATPVHHLYFFFLRNEALRIAYIDVVESIKNGKPSTEYYSKLVKADIHGKDKVSGNWFWMPFLLSNA
jgi:hypothetical protein